MWKKKVNLLGSLEHYNFSRWLSWVPLRVHFATHFLYSFLLPFLLLCSLPPTSIFCFMFCVCLGTLSIVRPIKILKTSPHKNKNQKSNVNLWKTLIKKEMCTDFEIIASNHDDGARPDITPRLRPTSQRQRHFQIITNDWSSPLTAFTTNLLMDGSTW